MDHGGAMRPPRRVSARLQGCIAVRVTFRLCTGGVLAILAVANQGCSQSAGIIFPAFEPAMVWPLPPEAPRIRYVGSLHSSADLSPAQSGWQRMRKRLFPDEHRDVRLVTPHALTVGADDRIYAVDTGLAALHIIDLQNRTQKAVRTIDGDRLVSPVGVAINGESVFVSDAALKAVFQLNLDGSFERRLNVSAQRPGGLASCAATGTLFLVDTAGHKFFSLPGGDGPAMAFGERGAAMGMFNFPTHIVCDGSSGVWVSDTLGFRVQRFAEDGTPTETIGKKGNAAGDFSLPKGVAIDSDGHLYVVDAHFENVQVFQPDGKLLLAFGEEGSGPGQFSIPGGIAIDRHDRIWVADAHNQRVQVFQYLKTPTDDAVAKSNRKTRTSASTASEDKL